jgi:hypothetical protein
MYVSPVAFLPYVMFTSWVDFWLRSGRAKFHARDPFEDAGAGGASHAALNAGTGRALVPLSDVTR